MPRPCKQRRICAMPNCQKFGPKEPGGGKRGSIEMTLDEFECIRLIDLEELTQEQCATRMNVARTTVQAIYRSARLKLAECLVMGKDLAIRGGDYVLCEGDMVQCGCQKPCRKQCHQDNQITKKIQTIRGMNMKIAVTYENGQVFQHFGHTERFKVYEVENGVIGTAAVVNTNGSGHGALADILKKIGVNTLICGGIGGGARRALDEAGIHIYGGVSGDADQAVAALLNETLQFDPAAKCDHHGEHHDGVCGEHGCGEQGCDEQK